MKPWHFDKLSDVLKQHWNQAILRPQQLCYQWLQSKEHRRIVSVVCRSGLIIVAQRDGNNLDLVTAMFKDCCFQERASHNTAWELVAINRIKAFAHTEDGRNYFVPASGHFREKQSGGVTYEINWNIEFKIPKTWGFQPTQDEPTSMRFSGQFPCWSIEGEQPESTTVPTKKIQLQKNFK